MTDTLDYLQAVCGDTVGRLHIAIGSEPYLTAKGKYEHKHWTQTHFAWPDEADQAEREIIRAATDSDVYVCPYLMHANKRTPGGAVARPIVHADVDGGGLDLDKVRALSGFVVASGSGGHGHVYVPLSESVPAHWHQALERGLVAYLGADPAKINANDVLRPPGTLNYKPTVFTPGSAPVPVEFLVQPGKVTVDPHTLARQLGVDMPSTELPTAPPASTNGHRQHTEPINLDDYPDVQAAIDKNTNDRSDDTFRVVAACRDAGLTLAQTRHAVDSRPDLAARLAERTDDDVQTCWLKVVDSRQAQAWAEPQVLTAVNTSSPGPPEPHDTAAENHSGQVRMAYRLANAYTDRLLYVHGIGWFYWAGTHWAEDTAGAAHRAVLDVLRCALADSLHDKELRSDVRKCESASGVAGVLAIAAALTPFAATVADLDTDPYLLNLSNGTLDLRTMELSTHTPGDRITKATRAAYAPESTTGVWSGFLERVLPHKDARDYLQRIIGVALVGTVIEHVLAILTGVGANGKSTLYKAICWALGDYASTAEPDLFMHRQNAHPTGEMDLLGRRLVVVSETEREHRMDEVKMKRLTGGDLIHARRMRQDFISFTPSHLPILITNHLPKVSGDDDATWRRLRVIPFDVVIPPEERDNGLDEALQVAADEVLAWALNGWVEYGKRKLDEPPEIVKATSAYQLASDAVRRFIDDECVTSSPVLKATTGQLHEHWEQWRVKDGAEPMSQKAFGQALDRLGYAASAPVSGKRWRQGISVKVVEDDAR